ncbi:MAG TPA: SpoIIE family protein phosphatase [Solirubrobacteraceae bacterium]|nr:SpoIIE family protein phosphatase [Solirubrobacteraceae bacterium]
MSDPDVQSIEPVLSARQELEFLAGAGAALTSSLDYEQTLRQVAHLAVPEVADWCGVYVMGDDGAEAEFTSGHADPELDAFITALRRRRREREGASESRRVAESGEPILATDVRGWTADEVDEGERELVSRLAAKSYMVVPLIARGRSIGSLTLLSTRPGRHYNDADLRFAQTLAGRCALAIDNARLHDAAERSLSLLDTVFATAPVGLAFFDPELRFVRINETMAAFNHLPVEEHLGRTIEETLGPAATELAGLYRRVLRTGEPLLDHELEGAAEAAPGDVRHWNISITPVHGPDGDVLGLSAAVVDVTERRRLLEAERDARTRADFLARAGSILDQSLDHEHTLRAVADIAIPEVADWCGVSILDEKGELQQVAAAHVDPAQRRLGEELNRRYPPGRDSAAGTVARTGQTVFVREITEAMLEAAITDPEQLDLVRRLALRSVIIAPLRARGRTFGTLTLANAESGRLFQDADVQLAEELARRAGLAIDNARLYTERSRIAHTLQVKLLPERLPDIPGAVVAARYRAAGELNEVGGDFYDVFPRSADEWAMVVGDVSGKGAEAAAITALARYTLRAGAFDDDEPAKALRRLNTAMLAHDDTSQFVTAVVAYVAAADRDHMRVRLSLAGHPPAAILRRGGRVETTGAFGTMLGLRADPAFHETELALDRGDVLLLYTDGVTEAGPRGRPFGERGLVDLLAKLAGAEPQDVVDAVEAAVVDAQEGQPRDDVALLALALSAE